MNTNMTPKTMTSLLILLVYWCSHGKARRTFDFGYNDEYFENLGENIQRQVAESLKPLNNLGARISSRVNEDVYEGLRPVREMQSKLKIIFGNDGTTVATYNPSGKQFIVKSGTFYTCSGPISEEDGQCTGALQKSSFSTKKDFCYANVNTIINNWYCIGTGSVNSGSVNGKVYCSSTDNSPTLLISAQDYKNLCAGVAESVNYKYFTNQKLTEYGNDVQCSKGTPQVCTTSVSTRFGTNNFVIIN